MQRVLALLILVVIPELTLRGETGPDSTKQIGVAAVPIIDYDPTFSLSVGAVGQLFYSLSESDTVSPPSSTGLFGLYAFNGSSFLAGFQKFHIDEDRWRILLAAGTGSVNFQFWQELPIVGGSFIGFNTKATFAAARVEREVIDQLYAGITGVYATTRTIYDLPEWVPDTFRSETVDMHNVGYQFTYDMREHQFTPYGGFYLSYQHSIYPVWLKNESTFHSFSISYNHFYPIRTHNHILATRFRARISAGAVPFQGQSVVGQDDIRGYTSGKYRDNQVYAMQAEYRWKFHRKFGAVAFFGLATATESLGTLAENELLPGGGVGFRYTMLPGQRINIGIDVAVGKEDWGLYFRIGEAFGR